MIESIVSAIAIFAVLSLPGWVLVCDRRRPLWIFLAAGICSQAAILLITAVLALALPLQLPAVTAVPIALVLALALIARRGTGAATHLPSLDPWALAVPTIATLTTALITSAAITHDEGDLIVHAWFNADGFKHMGHVQAIAAYGLPARDIFGGLDHLAYYWFYYVIPAIGVSLTGDAARSLIAAGLVQTFAFWVLVYGLVRTIAPRRGWAVAITLVTWLSPTPDGLMALIGADWDLATASTAINIEGESGDFLNGSPMFRLTLYISQHQFMLAGLMGWGLLYAEPDASRDRLLSTLRVAPLVSAGAISTLLGIGCLGVFACTLLLDRTKPLLRRLGRIVVVGAVALAVPLAFQIVGPSTDSLTSPMFEDPPSPFLPADRLMLAFPGIVLALGFFLVGLAGLFAAWRRICDREDSARLRNFATALVIVGTLILFGSTHLDNVRLAKEIQLRALLPVQLGLALGLAWLVPPADGRTRVSKSLMVLGAFLLVLGLPTPVMDTIWHGAPSEQWSVRIPAEDVAILEDIRRTTAPEDVVLQYPERPFTADGRGLWVPVLAGRPVFSSLRATHWSRHEPRYDAAMAFFSGSGPLPPGRYDLIYLSAALHPESYERLKQQLSAMPDWRERQCLPYVCVFERASPPETESDSTRRPSG